MGIAKKELFSERLTSDKVPEFNKVSGALAISESKQADNVLKDYILS
ncbi:hypothetical protein ACFFJX_28830 [Pseudarcicella hirudinis]